MTATQGRPMSTDPDVVRILVERLSIAFEERLIPRMAARVLAALLCSEHDAMTAKQLITTLGVSHAALSVAVNELIEVGVIIREKIPGSRRELFSLPPAGIVSAVMAQTTARPDIAAMAEEGIDLVGGPATPGGQRLREISEFFDFLDTEMAGIWKRWSDRATETPRSYHRPDPVPGQG